VLISKDHLDKWNEYGYAIIPNVLTPDEVGAAREHAALYFPTVEKYFRARPRYENLTAQRWFPFSRQRPQ
jgi:hypothetical protein